MTTEQTHATRAAAWPAAGGIAAIGALVAVIWIAYVSRIAHFDIDVFLRAGAAVADGRDPYPPPGTPEVYSGFAFVYPYLMSLPFVPLTWLHAGAEIFIALSVAAVLLGARQAGAEGWRSYALVLAASCTIIGFQMGTLNALLFLGMATLWRLRDRPLAAGLLAALLVYSKLFLAPVWLWLVLTRRLPAAGATVAILIVLFGVGELVSPLGTDTYAQMLSVLAREEAPDGMSATGLLMNLGLGLDVSSWAARLVAVAIVAACALAVRRGGDERLLFTGTVTAALIASPIVWAHYLLLLLVPVLVLTTASPTRTPLPQSQPQLQLQLQRRGLAADAPLAAFAAGSWLVVTPHKSDWLDLAVAAAIVGLLALPPLLAAGSGLVRRTPPSDRPRLFGAAALAVGAAAVVFGVLRVVALSHGDEAKVVGAYCALLGVLAILGWAASQSGGVKEPAARPEVTAAA